MNNIKVELECPKCHKKGAYSIIDRSNFLCRCGNLFTAEEIEWDIIEPQTQTSNTIPKISRQELLKHFKTEVDDIMDLMGYKNGNYGDDEDAFHNFRNTAMRIEGNSEPDSMYKMLMTYMDKHLCALAKNKMSDKEFIERHRDIIVYSLIAIGMKKELDQYKTKGELNNE